jgi:hypothetical protein
MGVKQLTNEELIDAYAYNNWLYSVNGKNFDILQENYKELLHRMEPSPIVKAMTEWKDSITISYFNKILYYNGVEYRLESVIGNSLSAHQTEQEAITALLG